jgi:hypothetical protein
MYLHIGDNVAVPAREVIGVFDLETSTVTRDTRDFLDSAQRNGGVRDICDDIPKAFVVTCAPHKRRSCLRPAVSRRKERDTVYITQLSSATIRKRAYLRKR